jgi:hypothetical protein
MSWLASGLPLEGYLLRKELFSERRNKKSSASRLGSGRRKPEMGGQPPSGLARWIDRLSLDSRQRCTAIALKAAPPDRPGSLGRMQG